MDWASRLNTTSRPSSTASSFRFDNHISATAFLLNSLCLNNIDSWLRGVRELDLCLVCLSCPLRIWPTWVVHWASCEIRLGIKGRNGAVWVIPIENRLSTPVGVHFFGLALMPTSPNRTRLSFCLLSLSKFSWWCELQDT